MNITKYKKVGQIANDCKCDACPIVIRKGTIYDDSSRGIRLLNLLVTNQGNITVDEICVKIVSYDENGNTVGGANGEKYQLCTLSGGCLPDQTIGESDVIVLPSRSVVSCDVFVSRVVTAGNVMMEFSEQDYVMKNTPRRVTADSTEKNRKLKKALQIALVAVGALYLVFGIGAIITNHVIVPRSNYSFIDKSMQAGNYADAIARADKIGDKEKREEVISAAIDDALASGNFESALKFAKKSESKEKQEETLLRVIDTAESRGDYEGALAYASAQNNLKMKNRVYTDAIAYCCSKGDFREALNYVVLSGMTEKKKEVYDAAVLYYRDRSDFVNAIDYALKSEDENNIRLVYDQTILSLVAKRDYDLAALYIGKCNQPDSTTIPASLKNEVFEKADRNYLLLNAKVIFPALSFTQIQKFYAHPIAVSTRGVGITKNGGAVGTDREYTVSGAVSVSTGEAHTAFLLANGTVVCEGENLLGECSTEKWTNITSLDCGRSHTVGVRADGTVLACGNNDYGQCNVTGWTDILQVACGEYFTIGLRSDGTAVACGANVAGQCNVSDWTDVILVSAGDTHALALHYDGTVSASGVRISDKCNVSGWKDVVDVAAGSAHSVGLTKDGKVLIAGGSQIGLSTISWEKVAAIAAGDRNVLAVSEGGTVHSGGSGKVKTAPLTDLAVG